MKTLEQLSEKPTTIPTATSWYLSDLGEARGRQELFTKQSPQRLKVLREHALIESAVSSNRIEGVTVDPSRLGAIVLGRALLRDRNEEEVRGYRDALTLIHERGAHLPVSEQTILKLHRLIRGDIWDAGRYKDKDIDIIERDPLGHHRIRFKTVPATKTRAAQRALITLWDRGLRERWVHPLIALAGMNLDFLCVHPFRDGNGRVSRLLLLLQSYHLGYEVGRYISLERLIEQHKDRYYETLERSSHRWHAGKHDPWPYLNYLTQKSPDAAPLGGRRKAHGFDPARGGGPGAFWIRRHLQDGNGKEAAPFRGRSITVHPQDGLPRVRGASRPAQESPRGEDGTGRISDRCV